MAQRPAAVIFDLDGCLWDPEMYELWGGGAPFSDNGDGTLKDRSGVTVRLLLTAQRNLQPDSPPVQARGAQRLAL